MNDYYCNKTHMTDCWLYAQTQKAVLLPLLWTTNRRFGTYNKCWRNNPDRTNSTFSGTNECGETYDIRRTKSLCVKIFKNTGKKFFFNSVISKNIKRSPVFLNFVISTFGHDKNWTIYHSSLFFEKLIIEIRWQW